MIIDNNGQHIYTESDICHMYMVDPTIKFNEVVCYDQINISSTIVSDELTPTIRLIKSNDLSIAEFDALAQQNWYLPIEYQNFDIAKYVLDLCQNEDELQRAGQELLLFQERNLFPLLIYLKYLVDTMRKNNIIWGVGRGSSVASFVLFLIGIHRINSLYYDLSITEFLK